MNDVNDVHMVDIEGKADVRRIAAARGQIILKESTVEAIREGRIKKGNVFDVARTAGILAVKKTPETIPLCHPIPITGITVDFELSQNCVACTCRVSADYKTGVEMEALCGVSAALLTVWDMTKYLEKDETGNYPDTRITGIEVVEKRKGGDS
ncbi:MAG: cyclic pyranopterin monophosphate synthase MoaC [Thermoplasmata archaeon HGW-Thermoplasmata-1]|nr:MAG: cyclic pyranopterin monophosphate synthase MoaC [Thermoplasmata archaeon HGW-Thermoplasmata-1]